ncbi:unnamed protein product [Chrysodeixis includens]|uniref:G-protein coupled receptors family 1 profile domain-containing protein n=1 Tax=Chrysodeixis includens TaxID=689277 RepID=A0A9P0BLT6_CHRIL|nr:unnamed protein product [Chrysodeixis includens]
MLWMTQPYPGLGNDTRNFSPVTMNKEWPTLGRLLFMVFCSVIGSTVNGFFVAAFFVEHALKRIGNVFLACVGMSDLIITTGVMPISAVVLLSGQWDILPVCQLLQFMVAASTYCYSLFFALVAAEGYFRLCGTAGEYESFLSMRIGLVAIMVFMISFITAGVGTFLDFDYDYCQRIHYGNQNFRIITTIIFHVIPFVITTYGLIATAIRIRRRAIEQLHYKRSQQYVRDHSMTNLNIAAYVIYVIGWTPYLIMVNFFPEASDAKYYHCAWIGVCRSLITSFLYSSLNRNFRRAFAHLFYYCCCKSSITGSFSSRHRRALEYKPATGDVRVHIMHQAVSMSSPQRGASSSRETQEL